MNKEERKTFERMESEFMKMITLMKEHPVHNTIIKQLLLITDQFEEMGDYPETKFPHNLSLNN